MGRRSKQSVLQRRHTDFQQTHEKTFNITNYQRNANQNHYDIPLYTGQNGHHQNVYRLQMLERCGEKGALLRCWQECKLVQPLWKTVWRFLRNLKIELPFDPAIPLLGIYPEKTMTQKDTCTPMFNTVLYTIVKIWKQSKYPLTEEWRKNRWNITQPLKGNE